MRILLALLALLTLSLAGCGRKYGEADGKLVCTREGKAFLVQPAIGDTSFVKRLSDADPQCQQWKLDSPPLRRPVRRSLPA